MWYFGTAHASLGLALALLVVWPELPGGFFYHPRMVAIVHLLTLGWLTSSIFGAFYIVGPLAFRIPMVVSRLDWWLAASFVVGASGVIAHAWIGSYDGLAWSAPLVLLPVVRIGRAAIQGYVAYPSLRPALMHVVLACGNLLAAAAYGAVIAWDRSRGGIAISPLSMALAHAHLASIGWVLMMIVGCAYRLVPMFVPCRPAQGRVPILGAVLLQSGALMLAVAHTTGQSVMPGALITVAGIVVSAVMVLGGLRHRLRRPPALPSTDWSLRQAATAAAWMAVAVGCGVWISASGMTRPALAWVYGVAALLGAFGQMVAGMAGRLVPMWVWFRAQAVTGTVPVFSAHDVPSARWARIIWVLWLAGVPLLATGLARVEPAIVRLGAGVMFAAVAAGAYDLMRMIRRAGVYD